ncbi:TPA: hypothetical protein QDC20_002758 [Burkholderia aenigmatica]|uniref:hypothetical protein n=1 Tax=Burkholderia sp. AU45251 TaxID=3059204 RepID=UPI00264F3FBA|nr:hypothetical protein [Burkholderia sp. AU45251]HDR9482204.1 hypothetical protein [Burkholderia aenigmatica]MDN7515160.1 hypothetical protein [Burkholderia sp. AU45251]HDR9515671.1 hypothetical protein [Burkholderia aenigmatica]HDR9590575.1 hypothetical protein [Burkholderia aenigmatica]HDR9598948.1 hypothetical protein [Burkholderia aenigmatica]
MNKLNAARLRANDFLEDIFLWKKCRNVAGWGIDGSAEGLPITLVVQVMDHMRWSSALVHRQLFGGHRG